MLAEGAERTVYKPVLAEAAERTVYKPVLAEGAERAGSLEEVWRANDGWGSDKGLNLNI